MVAPVLTRPGRAPAVRRFSPLGLVEALVTPHGVDRYLELVHPMLTVREMRAEVTAVTRTAPDSITLTLRPTRQWQGFKAGQFVQIAVDIDGVRRIRCYSPACSQHRPDGRIELTVKAHDGGAVSGYLNAHARPGLVVGLSPADGTFCLPDARPDRILLISGGSGITPVLSMLRTLCDEGYADRIAFLHYARNEETLSYRDELGALAAAHPGVRIAIAYTGQDGGDLSGHFTEAHLRHVAPWFGQAETFVCGPPALMQAVGSLYDEQRISDRLHTEQFVLAPAGPIAGSPADGTVTFARTGASAGNSGATLLEQAEAAGIDAPFGCRMGICFSCTQRKTSGCTRDIRTGETNADPDTEVQLCINVPVGDVALDL